MLFTNTVVVVQSSKATDYIGYPQMEELHYMQAKNVALRQIILCTTTKEVPKDAI